MSSIVEHILDDVVRMSLVSSVDIGGGYYVLFGNLFKEEDDGTALMLTGIPIVDPANVVTKMTGYLDDWNILRGAIIENYLMTPNSNGEYRLPVEIIENDEILRPYYFRARLSSPTTQPSNKTPRTRHK